MGKDISKCKVLIMGATFKENVEDIRNSKVADVVNEFKSYGVKVEVSDPKASSEDLKKEYGFGLIEKPGNNYDALIIAVNHREYENFDEEYFRSICAKDAVIVDVKGVYRKEIKSFVYWSL